MTVDEIYGQMVQIFQQETGLTLAGDGDMAVRLYAVAAQIYALYVQGDWVGRQWRRRGCSTLRRIRPRRPI